MAEKVPVELHGGPFSGEAIWQEPGEFGIASQYILVPTGKEWPHAVHVYRVWPTPDDSGRWHADDNGANYTGTEVPGAVLYDVPSS